ncbi:exonuclease domain-containing protein [[Clostridium] dakarense]|uniref:exonuclease domain-containing protein n=1 Tax=Faecalimicrobium dakarense TaxID=1301100 RepID=UPI0004B712F8|nr:exonuclease domain-containing protein [[Clostridium] dakarense]
MDFVSIDFETSNAFRASACSLGITVVKNSKIVEERYWLIKPDPFIFDSRNIQVHGIREADVINEKEFDELWPQIKPYLEGQLVIAHNASFDISVLRNTLDKYSIEYPVFDYACTLVASRIFYNYLNNFKLSTVNKHLGYKFKHHHASEDASACANILLEISKELNLDNIYDISKLVGFKLGSLGKNSYTPCSKLHIGMTSSKSSTYNGDEINPLFNSDSDYFKGKVVSFTGALSCMERHEAKLLISSLGGIAKDSVTRKTDILITNTPNIDKLDLSQMSSKLRTSVRYNNVYNQNIMFLNEEELESILMGYPASETN